MWLNLNNRAKISIRGAGVASCRQVRDNVWQPYRSLNPYRCDHCGTENVVAAPVLYQQGTRVYSGTFSSETADPTLLKLLRLRPCAVISVRLFFGDREFFFSFVWTTVGLRSIFAHPTSTGLRANSVGVFLFVFRFVLDGCGLWPSQYFPL